uniref:Large ribosomal subunit protein uL3m n=1 Tax=Panagrolaimus sp. JU765 TaxID=591449 RepID=A0AC34R2E2_9BILA
ITVGAGDLKSLLYVSPFDKLLMKQGLNPKQHYGSFLVTEDGIIPPGTNSDVRHFNIGQYVNVTGRTIDWGFQGAMHRWGFRGLPDRRTTKAHRRVGSIGIKGEARVWPGQRLPGHMGHEWRQTSGLEILRINPIAQVIYVKGCVAGSCGSVVLMNDCLHESKRAKDVPFPTFVSEESQQLARNIEEMNLAELTAQDLYAEKLFKFTSPSIAFTEAHEKKSAARDKTRAKIAKVKK